MELSKRAQKIADTYGHEWMAERIVSLEDIRDAAIAYRRCHWIRKNRVELDNALRREHYGLE